MELELLCPHCGDYTYHEEDPEWLVDWTTKTECMNCSKEFYFETETKITPVNIRKTEEDS